MKWNIRNRQRNKWKNIIVISSFFRDFFSRVSVVPRFYFERSYVSINLKFTVDTRNALIVHFFPLLQYIFIRLFCSRWLYNIHGSWMKMWKYKGERDDSPIRRSNDTVESIPKAETRRNAINSTHSRNIPATRIMIFWLVTSRGRKDGFG